MGVEHQFEMSQVPQIPLHVWATEQLLILVLCLLLLFLNFNFSSLLYNRFVMLITVSPSMRKLLSVFHLQPLLAFVLLRALNKRGHTALKSTVYRMAHSWQGKAGVTRAR